MTVDELETEQAITYGWLALLSRVFEVARLDLKTGRCQGNCCPADVFLNDPAVVALRDELAAILGDDGGR